ncbi:hypothetical protein [Methanocella sp. MCL-LM]
MSARTIYTKYSKYTKYAKFDKMADYKPIFRCTFVYFAYLVYFE